jgi:cell division protein FtsI/penicillin-binding protein 2
MSLYPSGALLLLLSSTATAWAQQTPVATDALFRQSASATLAHSFTDPNISYLLLDVDSGALIAERWDSENIPIATGSLVKPFTALAYAEGHQGKFPVLHCLGKKTCWLPRGHGTIGITAAIAHSCNSYFHQLSAAISATIAEQTLIRFGLASVTEESSSSTLAGMNKDWKNTPLSVANAYAELFKEGSDPSVNTILRGMRLSAQVGTGHALSQVLKQSSALVKTGTAPCSHEPKGAGDGFAVVAVPAESPRILLLVRAHGMPGSKTAAIAAHMLAQTGVADAK